MRTRVGYAGGTKKGPTYYSLGDHSETVEIDYDPARISYGQLLDILWSAHNPERRAWSRQYRSAIFYHGEDQKRLAIESKRREEARRGRKMHTEILPAERFYPAEPYHQKYLLRQYPELLKELGGMYPAGVDLMNSTAAARINGYLGGNGSLAALEEEIDGFGLSQEGKRRLLSVARGLEL